MIVELADVRPLLERAWNDTLGRTAFGRELGVRVRRVEDYVRPIIWRRSAPLREIELVDRFLRWLANSTKHEASTVPSLDRRRTFVLPTAAATLRNMERHRLALPTSDDPEVSIVIPVYNHFAFTYACLESIARDPSARAYEVIVVDDCSMDETARMLATVDGIRVVRNAENLGFIGACNAGAAAARGRYLVFLNNDTEVQPGWLRELRDTFDAEPTAGLVGSKLVYPDGRLQEAGGIVWRNAVGWNVGRLDDPEHPQYSYLRRADYVSGASIMIPRALFESLGGFDTHFAPAYYEDTDLAFRVRAAGREVFYQPLSRVYHFEGLTSGTDVTSGVKQYQVVNQHKFAARWLGAVAGHGIYGEAPEREKDRGVGGRILVVDVMTPEPDRDSGSMRMFNLLQVLRQLGMKVTFLPANLAEVEGYTAALRRRGVEVLCSPYVTNPERFIRLHADDYDVVMFSRPEVAEQLLGVARRWARKARLIYDTVDLHHLREEREARVKNDATLLKQARQTREQEIAFTRLADATLVVSPIEKELLERAAPGVDVRVLSNIHDVPGCAAPFHERRDLVFIGLYRHRPNVDAVLWFVREVLPRVRAQLRNIKLYVVGSEPPEEIRRLASEDVIVTGFVPDIAPYLARCKMTVAPLRFGAGVKGKVNLSLSHGVPVVATTIAVEGMHLVPDREVLLADEADAFAAAVVRLHCDEIAWQQLSQAGIAHTKRHFSFATAMATMRELIEDLLPALTAAPSTLSASGALDANSSLG